jgi:hypothetical protein
MSLPAGARLLARRLVSSAYRGGGAPARPPPPGDAFQKARADRLTRRPGGGRPAPRDEAERTLFRREEAIGARLLGPLALFNLGGALFFCATVARGGRDGGPVAADDAPAAPPPGRVVRAAACVVALTTAVGVAAAAARFTRRRLVEVRVAGRRCVRLYTRSMAGVPPLVQAHEVPVGAVAVDFGRLRAAARVRETAAGKRAAGGDEASYVSFRLADASGGVVEGATVYTIDTLDASVLDVNGIESVAQDLRPVRGAR